MIASSPLFRPNAQRHHRVIRIPPLQVGLRLDGAADPEGLEEPAESKHAVVATVQEQVGETIWRQLFASPLSKGHVKRCTGVIPRWDKAWAHGLADAQRKEQKTKRKTPVSILPTLFRSFGPDYLFSSTLMLVLSVLQFAR